jgi:antirestriction protein ArdC
MTARVLETPPRPIRLQVPTPQAYFEPINWHRTALHELGH